MGTRAARADMRTDRVAGTAAIVAMVVAMVTLPAAIHTLARTRPAATRGTRTVRAIQ